MAETIEEIDLTGKISKNELLCVLKEEASRIHIHDLMRTSAYLHQETKYLPGDFRENFINIFIKGFINRFKEVKEDKKEYEGYIDTEKLKEFLKTLKIERKLQQEYLKITSEEYFLKFSKITEVVAIYTTFILETSVHQVGTLFPGESEVKFKDEVYLCPAKEKNLDNPYALCRFCVSKQDETV